MSDICIERSLTSSLLLSKHILNIVLGLSKRVNSVIQQTPGLVLGRNVIENMAEMGFHTTKNERIWPF